jgi:hypothetical protein
LVEKGKIQEREFFVRKMANDILEENEEKAK